MPMLKRGVCIRLQSATVVVLLRRASRNGWDCLCLHSLQDFYKYQDVFVFDEDLKNGEEVIAYEGGARS